MAVSDNPKCHACGEPARRYWASEEVCGEHEYYTPCCDRGACIKAVAERDHCYCVKCLKHADGGGDSCGGGNCECPPETLTDWLVRSLQE